jgi:hypothetical protein
MIAPAVYCCPRLALSLAKIDRTAPGAILAKGSILGLFPSSSINTPSDLLFLL